jgi:hypothetical protein
MIKSHNVSINSVKHLEDKMEIADVTEKRYKTLLEKKASATKSTKRPVAKKKKSPWKFMKPKDGRWVLDVKETSAGAAYNLTKGSDFLSLFVSIISPALLERVVLKTESDQIPVRTPPRYVAITDYKLPGTKKFKSELNLSMFYRYYAVRIYTMFTNSIPMKGESFEEDAINRTLHTLHCHQLSAKSFKSLHNYYLILPEMMAMISDACERCVTLGEFLCLDEKLAFFSGDSPMKRIVPNKPAKVGHWITMAAVTLRFSKLPYVVRFVPVDQKIAVHELVKEAIGVVQRSGKNSIIAMDSYYTCYETRKALMEAKVRYLGAVSLVRHQDIFGNIKIGNAIGSFAVKYNQSTDELAVAHRMHGKKKGRKRLLTNAFRLRTGEEQLDAPGSLEYSGVFNVCDTFNAVMSKRGWPFRRGNYLRAIDDYILTAVLINIYHLLREFVPDDKRSIIEFCKDGALQLVQLADKLGQQVRRSRDNERKKAKREEKKEERRAAYEIVAAEENLQQKFLDAQEEYKPSLRQRDRRERQKEYESFLTGFFAQSPSFNAVTPSQLFSSFERWNKPAPAKVHLFRVIYAMLKEEILPGLSVTKSKSKSLPPLFDFVSKNPPTPNTEQEDQSESTQLAVEGTNGDEKEAAEELVDDNKGQGEETAITEAKAENPNKIVQIPNTNTEPPQEPRRSQRKRRTPGTINTDGNSKKLKTLCPFYWEPQSKHLCGKHALNVLTGSNLFSQAGLDQSAKKLQATLLLEGKFRIPLRDFKKRDGDYSLDVLMAAVQEMFDLNPDDQPQLINFTTRNLPKIMNDHSDLLILEDRSHWLVWRKDVATGLWWDLNSLGSPKRYTLEAATKELRKREVQLFGCANLRQAIYQASPIV